MIYAVFPDNVKEITVYGLTQWDKGRKLQITLPSLPASFEVHFANKRAELAYPVKGTSSGGVATVSIPNIVLMNSADVVAWVYDSTSDDVGETIATINLPLARRTKPADYYYTEDALEVIDYSSLKEQVDQLSEQIDGLTGNIYVGATQPINGVEYWLDTSEDGDENTGGGDSGGGEEEPDTPIVPETYTITRTLTGCTSSSTATSITEGSYYKETITAEDGYTLSGADVTITMGGVDISDKFVDGVLTIDEVTGDIVITIIATVDAWETLTLNSGSSASANKDAPIYSDDGTTEIGTLQRSVLYSDKFEKDTTVSVTVTNTGVTCYVGRGAYIFDGATPTVIYDATAIPVGVTQTVEMVIPTGQQLIACGNYTQHWTVEAKKKV